jgi:prolyl 4-hydroxylase
MTDAQYQQAIALFDQGRHAEGAQVLGQAAQAGHVPSMSLLGGQLLTGRGVPADTPTGIRLIMAAAERGGAFACATAANLFAWGFYTGQPNWPRALDYLQRAAELGYAPARTQLRLLSGYKAGIDWKKLRRAVDVAALRKFPTPRPLSKDPQIRSVPGLLSGELCDTLIAQARPRLGPATIYNELEGGHMMADGRRHSAAQFHITDMDLVMMAVTERLCALAGLPLFHAESLQVLHYEVGETFKPHVDFWEPKFEGHAVTLAKYGQRVFTVLVYLNDDLEGGETDFPRLGLRYRGEKKGDGLIFRNVDAEGQGDYRTLHAGLPPTRGEKWVLSLWIRDRAPDGYGDPRTAAAMEGR